MNKTELVAAVAEDAGISKKDAERAVNAFVNAVMDEVKGGGKVQLIGFLSYSLVFILLKINIMGIMLPLSCRSSTPYMKRLPHI